MKKDNSIARVLKIFSGKVNKNNNKFIIKIKIINFVKINVKKPKN